MSYISPMPRKRNTGGFIWDEGQCFFGADGHVVTSYTHNQLTLSIVQNESGKLIGLTYETDDQSGDIVFEQEIELSQAS